MFCEIHSSATVSQPWCCLEDSEVVWVASGEAFARYCKREGFMTFRDEVVLDPRLASAAIPKFVLMCSWQNEDGLVAPPRISSAN